ncbi:helix-turn-helix domain-containing protein [Tundrisphaera lichenicola]|uniref:helix-turn-helix domain-containing protein n=1 Tax=Tundrisphaera lichenicola TaxID=2029860 RepID=UPI003EBE4430
MATFYSLEEAARHLGMSPDELKLKAQHREVRAFMESGSWQFRVVDIEELARRRGLGSDPELSLSDLELEVPDGSGSDEIDLSEFQLGIAKPDLGGQTGNIPASTTGSDEHDVQFDDLSLPPGPLSNSSSTIIGMKPGGKKPSDSDVRLVPDTAPLKDASDSDVRLMPSEPLRPSDSDVTLVNDDASLPEIGSLGYPGDDESDSGIHQQVGSSAEVSSADHGESGSDFELTPSSDIAAALQPESGSDFELTALDASDEFEAAPLAGPSDSDVTAAQPSASGINLARPSDSGINLQSVGGFDLSQADSIELAPLDDDEPARPAPKAKAKAPTPPKQDPNSATVMPGVKPSDPGATSMGMTEKDIFEDTDFSLEVDALDSDHDDRTVQIDRSSDFDLEESDSASEVFALDEDDVDQNAATAMGAALADDESGEFSADADSGEVASGWDVESDVAASSPSAAAAVAGARLVPAGPQAEWGGIWVGLLGATSFLILVSMVFSIDLIRNLYEFQGDGPASGLIKSIAGLFG